MDDLHVECLESNQPLLQKSKSSIEKIILNLKSSKMAKMMVQEVEKSTKGNHFTSNAI